MGSHACERRKLAAPGERDSWRSRSHGSAQEKIESARHAYKRVRAAPKLRDTRIVILSVSLVDRRLVAENDFEVKIAIVDPSEAGVEF